MLFDTYVWTQIKDFLIDYRLVKIHKTMNDYDYVAQLGDSWVRCYCNRMIKFSKFSNHLKSRSHNATKYNIIKKVIDIEEPIIITYKWEKE